MTNPWKMLEFRRMVPTIIETLDPPGIRMGCDACGIITLRFKKSLTSIRDPIDHNERLLDELRGGDADSFHMFLSCIRDSETDTRVREILAELEPLDIHHVPKDDSRMTDNLKVVGMNAAPASLFASLQNQGMPDAATTATTTPAATATTPAATITTATTTASTTPAATAPASTITPAATAPAATTPAATAPAATAPATTAPAATATTTSTPTNSAGGVTSIDQVSAGMRLEAADRKNPGMTGVASIKKVNDAGSRVEIHFDGWLDSYNYWCDITDNDIHPVGWCAANCKTLHPPIGLAFGGWKSYLSRNNFACVPEDVFTDQQKSGMSISNESTGSVPSAINEVSVGMRLEAVDVHNPNLTSVASISAVDVTANTVEIYFDGWSNDFTYWCNLSDTNIHPIGWCKANGKELIPPHGIPFTNWSSYLATRGYKAVPRHVFTLLGAAWPDSVAAQQAHGMTPPASRFAPAMRLEARDRLNPHMMCVARVAHVEGSSMLIALDGCSQKYNYWCSPDSDDIHPVGWCDRVGFQLQPPKGRSSTDFDWKSYLQEIAAVAAPKRLFADEGSTRVSCFMKSMKLEAKDPAHPGPKPAYGVASIAQVQEGRLFIHFDGRSNDGDYWCERSSPDIHPIGWCGQSGLELCKPPGLTGCFIWSEYIKSQNARAVPTYLFTELQQYSSPAQPQFKPSMRLEAKGRKSRTSICVAAVQKTRGKTVSSGMDICGVSSWKRRRRRGSLRPV
ncbi:MBT domain-containing protein 1-like isoform X2 [Sycon ciliatum]